MTYCFGIIQLPAKLNYRDKFIPKRDPLNPKNEGQSVMLEKRVKLRIMG